MSNPSQVSKNCILLAESQLSVMGGAIRRSPCLLDQLREAVSGSGEIQTGFTSGSSGGKVPIAVNAFDLEQRIKQELDVWWMHYCEWKQIELSYSESVKERIVIISHTVLGKDEDKLTKKWAKLTDRWILRITNLLDPPLKMHLNATCPECGVKMAKAWNEEEEVNVPALNLSEGTCGPICVCLNCGTEWSGMELRLLASRLGC